MLTRKNKVISFADFGAFAAPVTDTGANGIGPTGGEWLEAGSDNAADRRRYLAFARGAMDFLPPKQREAVALYILEGRRIPAISRELGVAPSTVSRRLAAARKTLHALGDLYLRSGFFRT